jgi:hypothetical protein
LLKMAFDSGDKVGRRSAHRENDRCDSAAGFSKRLGPQDDRKGPRPRGQFGEQRSFGQLTFENDAKDGV